jgi:hypothetical protein
MATVSAALAQQSINDGIEAMQKKFRAKVLDDTLPQI